MRGLCLTGAFAGNFVSLAIPPAGDGVNSADCNINRQLSGWNLPPLVIRAFGAHCQVWTGSLLFDHLVGAPDQRVRNTDAERPCCLEVDTELDLRALLDRQLARLFAFENPSHVDARHAVSVGNAAAITHEATGDGELPVFENGWHRVADGKCGELFLVGKEDSAAADHEPACPHLDHVCDGRIELAFGAGIEDTKLHPEIRAASCISVLSG